MKLKKSCSCSKVCTFITQHDTSYKSCTRSCSLRNPSTFWMEPTIIWKIRRGFFTPLWCFCLKFQCACENLFCSQTWSITHLKKDYQISGLLKHFGPVAGLKLEHHQHNTKLLQLTVHNSVRYIFYTKHSQAILLRARNQCIKQSFYTISCISWWWPITPETFRF
jgi:hypothetical protein